jgi:hypothetical protein
MFNALGLMEELTGKAWFRVAGRSDISAAEARKKGNQLLTSDDDAVDQLEILGEGLENSDRKVVLLKVRPAYQCFLRMIRFYGIKHLIAQLQSGANPAKLPGGKRAEWVNLGGQLVPEKDFRQFRQQIRSGRLKGWDDVHSFYQEQATLYSRKVMEHGLASLREITGINTALNQEVLQALLSEANETAAWINEGIFQSRQKDYENPFRKMVYENEAEMEKVIGRMEDNSFIRLKQEETKKFIAANNALLRKLKRLNKA